MRPGFFLRKWEETILRLPDTIQARGKKRLEAQIKAATDAGKTPGTALLLSNRGFMDSNILVKKPGQTEWVPYADMKATKVTTPTSPDGSEVDQVLPE